MDLIHARLASKKANTLSHAVDTICQAPDFYGLGGAHLAASMFSAMAPSNFPISTPFIYLSMMIQGDDGYGRWLWS